MPIRTIEVRERVMARNDELAAEVRRRLAQADVPAFNLESSPGGEDRPAGADARCVRQGDAHRGRHRRRADAE
jgi:hypothetical protein